MLQRAQSPSVIADGGEHRFSPIGGCDLSPRGANPYRVPVWSKIRTDLSRAGAMIEAQHPTEADSSFHWRTVQNQDGLSGDGVLIEAQHPAEPYSSFHLAIRRN